MSANLLSQYSAKIKSVYIELKDYRFFHSPYNPGLGKRNERFIGRDKVNERIVSALKHTDVKSGSYLVTGFRGMGKTSVVRKAIDEFNRQEIEDFCRRETEKSHRKEIERSIGRRRIGDLIRTEGINAFEEIEASDCGKCNDINAARIEGFFRGKRAEEFIGERGVKAYPGNIHEQSYSTRVEKFYRMGIERLLRARIESVALAKVEKFIRSKYGPTSPTKQAKETIWRFFKLFVFVLLGVLILAFFMNPLFVFSLISDSERGESIINAFFPSVLSSENGYVVAVVSRVLVSLLVFYFVLTLLFFASDFVHLVKTRIRVWMKRGFPRQYYCFEINLSQDSLDEMDILRRMAIALESYWLRNKIDFESTSFRRRLYKPWLYIASKLDRDRKDRSVGLSHRSIGGKLGLLRYRMSGQLTTRRERNAAPNITTPIAGLAEVTMPLLGTAHNDEVAYPLVNAKEAEDQLREILDDVSVFRERNPHLAVPEFVFVIDELDKIDPHSEPGAPVRESSNPVFDKQIYAEDANRFRQRRDAIGRLLANLKGFLSVVQAKFFFIGGREMFDADLADIADRESFYSSIFNDVIYVESFFKDSIEVAGPARGGVTQMTETYLCKMILGMPDSRDASLKGLFDSIEIGMPASVLLCKTEESDKSAPNLDPSRLEERKKQKYKLISTLQNYIIYLTYRSSGMPKKLTGLTEQLIVKGPRQVNGENEIDNSAFFDDNIVLLHDRGIENFAEVDLSDKLFLKFGFDTQYEIGLTADLYRPYLIANSRQLKSFGDKLLFSSSFIIDHLLKFHPFGFAWRNLELIPEVVLVNREPNLREFIEDLMRFYSMNYIRDTVSGIFDYRFRGVIRKELIQLSKTSDLSAAAFNFTLDESFSTKRHYKRKLIELRKNYENYSPVENDNRFVHSIHFVQTILGDLHFYDKEYDEAVVYYTESIQALRLPDAVAKRRITRHQFLLWVKNELKLGLTLEKMRAFDSAFSLYKTLVLDTDRYFRILVSKEPDQDGVSKEIDNDNKARNPKHAREGEAEDHRTIHLVSMPFVALLAVTEKARNDGITYTNLLTNRREFRNMINAAGGAYSFDIEGSRQQPPPRTKNRDRYRKNYLLADYYNNVGSILYYKNCQFTRFFDLPEDYSKDEGPIMLEVFSNYHPSDGTNEALHPVQEQQRESYLSGDSMYDFFPSLTAFTYYWNSLYFLLEYHIDRIETKILARKAREGQEGNLHEIREGELRENLLALCSTYLLPECSDMVSSNRLYYIANVVSKIGDTILASLTKSQFAIPSDEAFNALDITDSKDIVSARTKTVEKFYTLLKTKNIFTAETVLHTYKLASALYLRSGHPSYYASHLMRILYVIKDLIELNKPPDLPSIAEVENDHKVTTFLGIDFLHLQKNTDSEEKEKETTSPFRNVEKIAEAIFKATTWNNEIANRPQILKYRDIFDLRENRDTDRHLIYNLISNISDNREAIILVESIKLKLLGRVKRRSLARFTLGKGVISSYGMITNRHQRILELKYRAERCHFIMTKILNLGALLKRDLDHEKAQPCVSGPENAKDLIEVIKNDLNASVENLTVQGVVVFLIQEALFCLIQSIKMIKLYNPGYLIGYSFLAEAHARMGDWCLAYENYLRLAQDTEKKEFHSRIEKLVGDESLIYLESKTHYESAVQYYYDMIQMHSDGKAYKDKLHEIFMLEDDYNDNLTHYTIAAERIRINTGKVRERIEAILEERVKESKLYEYDSYFPPARAKQPPVDEMNRVTVEMNGKIKEGYREFFKNELKNFNEEGASKVVS